MTERERSKDRPQSHSPSHHASSSSGSGGLFMNLFGGGSKKTGSAPASRNPSTRQVGKRDSLEELRSPKSVSPQLSLPVVGAGGDARAPSPQPEVSAAFDLQTSLAILQPGTEESTTKIVDTVNTVAAWLYNLHLTTESIFTDSNTDTSKAGPNHLTPADIRTLYIRAFSFAQSNSDTPLRLAGIRLLAVLFETSSPEQFTNVDKAVQLPESISTRSLYKRIVAPTAKSQSVSHVDTIFVEVGALKALTKNGSNVEGLNGIVGWLLKSLQEIQDDWIAWCMQEEKPGLHSWSMDPPRSQQPGPIKVASPADAAVAITELLSQIVASQIALIAPADFDKIINSLLVFAVVGINASVAMHSETMSPTGVLSRNSSIREAPHGTALHSPTGSSAGTGMGSNQLSRHSSLIRRSRQDKAAATGSPPPKQQPQNRQSTASSSLGGITSPRMAAASAIGLRSPSPRNLRDREPAKWAAIIPPLSALLVTAIDKSPVSKHLLEQIIAFVCFCFGQDEDEVVPEAVWAELSDVCGLLLGRRGGRRGQVMLREVLEGKASLQVEGHASSAQAERKLARGAVIASRFLLNRLNHTTGDNTATMPFPILVSSLRAAQSTSRFESPEDSAKRRDWLPVDMEILALLQDNLFALEDGVGGQGNEGGSNEAWAEGDAACQLLRGFLPVAGDATARSLLSARRPLDPYETTLHRFIAVFDEVINVLPSAIGRLDSSTSTDPIFQHPKYIELLLSLNHVLDEEYAATVLSFYRRECLCLPFTTGWTANLNKLLDSFFFPLVELPSAKKQVTTLLFDEVFSYANEIAEKREKLMREVILPFMDKALKSDQTEDFYKVSLAVFVDAAIAETLDKDTDFNRWRGTLSPEELDKVDLAASPGDKLNEIMSDGYFDQIRAILIKIATQTPCKLDSTVPPPHRSALFASPLPPPAPTPSSSQSGSGDTTGPSSERKPSGKAKEQATAGSTLRGLMDALSPPSKSRDITPASSSLTSPSIEMDGPSLDASALSLQTPHATSSEETVKSPPTMTSPTHPHVDCISGIAVVSLISIFLKLTFAHNSSSSLSSYAVPTRSPSTIRCIAIFQDLLDLLFPMTDNDPKTPRDPKKAVKIPAQCPRARLSILQLFMRLRADSRHQTYLRLELDRGAVSYATTLKRTKETEAEKKAEIEMTQRKASARQAARGDGDERGRAGRSAEPSTRSRSRSTQPLLRHTTESTLSYTASWLIPDHLGFDVPSDVIPTGGIATYDPSHPLLDTDASATIDGVWLPVSRYIRALNGILRGHDWELVSYILTFLPLQLSNKLFFHGTRATKEIRSLLEVLCNGVSGIDAWERRYNVPSFIKRVDINAVAYQSLSILIAYRGLFSRAECDRLVQAFMTGLQGKGDVAKPCIQAITIAVFELEQSVSRYLLDIVRSMISILTTTGLAVHILEFLISLGQNGNIFRNFTDEQYRLVFRVAITYITEHNARSDQAVDLQEPATREAYILSQHVIGLAYYAIYIWFMALRLPQRPALVTEITRELLKGRSQRKNLDEMAEVCFDWLARYTYGNADPKPSTSFLSEIVMSGGGDKGEETKSQSWLLGGCIVTVTSHARTGWATIATTRPTGSTSVICKLENVPHLDLGEANADLVSLPAVLMANRDVKRTLTIEDGSAEVDGEKSPPAERATSAPTESANGAPTEVPAKNDHNGEAANGDEPVDPKKIVQVQSSQQTAANFDQSSQHGYIWSGATPSQRRKDVSIDPSYIAMQLLSSYPNASLETPRGQLIPPEDKFARALRGIQNTPVIDTLKIAVLYVARNQTTEQEILSNTNGPTLYLDFLAGLGRLIRLKGQVDVFVGGLNRDNDSDGEYAYAWWDDLSQMIFHTPSMMPNLPQYPNSENKKRLVGNDYVKIVYNNSGKEFVFDTIKTEFNFINIVISPHCTGPGEDELPPGTLKTGWRDPVNGPWAGKGVPKSSDGDQWLDWDRTDWFKVTLQRAEGIPDFSPIGTHKLVSKRTLPVLVRHIARLANDMAARYVHIRDARDAGSAEYITSWRSRLRAMARLRQMLPAIEVPTEEDAREQMIRDFTRIFSYRPPAPAKD